MKERPILFSSSMVRALLAGTKTQTRRMVKPAPVFEDGQWVRTTKTRMSVLRDNHGPWKLIEDDSPFGVPGDRLWCKETWLGVYDCQDWDCGCGDGTNEHRRAVYRATEPDGISGFCRSWDDEREAVWKPSIFMPRWASRITLEVTGVRVERVQDISEEDAKAEGAKFFDGRPVNHHGWRHDEHDVYATARDSFFGLWRSINGADSLAANPWVWCISFRRVDAKSEAA